MTAAAPGVVTQTGWLAGYEDYGQVVMVELGGGLGIGLQLLDGAVAGMQLDLLD